MGLISYYKVIVIENSFVSSLLETVYLNNFAGFKGIPQELLDLDVDSHDDLKNKFKILEFQQDSN